MEAQFGFGSEMVEGVARVSVMIPHNCSEEFSSLLSAFWKVSLLS